jgi:SH3-like domain-containing protein
MKNQTPLLILFCAAALSACAPAVLTPSPSDIQTAIAQTEAAAPEPTATLVPTNTVAPTQPPTTTPTHTPTPRGPISGSINAAFLNMREGPSTFFAIVQTYTQGQALEAIARSEDSEWVQVQMTDDQQQGWMATLFLELAQDAATLPVLTPPNTELISGVVQDQDGNPIDLIGIAIINREGAEELRADASSGLDGRWSVLIPANTYTLLDVQIVGYGCESIIMDDDCNLSGYFELEGRAFLNLPQEADLVFQFAAVSRTLSGTVVDLRGTPVPDMLVVGERDDGAEALAYTDADGLFTLGAASGAWELYTVTFDPRTEGERLTVEVGAGDVTGLELREP